MNKKNITIELNKIPGFQVVEKNGKNFGVIDLERVKAYKSTKTDNLYLSLFAVEYGGNYGSTHFVTIPDTTQKNEKGYAVEVIVGNVKPIGQTQQNTSAQTPAQQNTNNNNELNPNDLPF